ncbi:liprin-beta-2b isoform X4 [Dunckerocampus dactyliophorus]|uniref:liprin-beta-2b isoform X4 n=1 Tax=Dunckerocampus dactyliophorus TaxID=161453 RepID=UPI002404ACA7|nr:liprin-beta-2b isoform X4 [Dunckerocampus dactyliophorus]
MLATVTMETEASHMLEAALEQMDDIIAGSKAAGREFSNGVYDDLGSSPLCVVRLAEDLKAGLELQPSEEDREKLRAQLPTETAQALLDWLHGGDVNLCSPANHESYQERLLRLEEDKESLVLQRGFAEVSVLTDQVEAQGEKIRDLESSLEEHRQKLASTEEMLQQELVSRTSLETQKLDLMDEVSYLKLKLISMEDTHNTHMEDAVETKQNKAECVVNLISELQEQMCRFQEEISTRIEEKRMLEERGAHRGELPSDRSRGHGPLVGLSGANLSLCDSDAWMSNGGLAANDLFEEVKQLKNKVEELEVQKGQYEKQLGATKAQMSEMQHMLASKDAEIERLQTQLVSSSANDNAERDQEYQRLKVGMESLLASNDEKTRRIEELTHLLGQYRKMSELVALTRGSSEEELSASLKVRAIKHKTHPDVFRFETSSRGSSPLTLSSSPCQRDLESCFQNSRSLLFPGDSILLDGSWHQRRLQSSSLEELHSRSLQKNPHVELSKYQTLPGKLRQKGEQRPVLNGDREEEEEEDVSPVRVVYSHDRGYTLISCRSASAPALGSPTKHHLDYPGCSETADLSDQSPLSYGQQSALSAENRKSHRGIKKLWGFIRRSQSGSPVQVQDPELRDFKRGGIRATAGPRLAPSLVMRDSKVPLCKWTAEQTCVWLEDIGLGQYVVFAGQWVTSGQTLLSATPHDLEKEMGMKNPLHRKKLQLAIRTLSSTPHQESAELDYLWVTRWLDDIGLPQYKDQFSEARVDGQMLQYLTVSDLLILKVSSQLHHLSIKCGIHVLHLNKFNPNCLKRRPSTQKQFTRSEVVQWSNHRVMEWLRSVDLAEYAPNLRGSGVHGGLIMLEPGFSADTLALLLNIPPHKTLLRRHLSTNFTNLLGRHAQQEKRRYADAANFTPLSITAKVKTKKLVFSNLTHLRRRRPEESQDYVCPVDSVVNQTLDYANNLDPHHCADQVGAEGHPLVVRAHQ